ncbi:MAG: response regulator [candidate division Zixibacteria bacterium]|nr:response regulator [candidate division Zixibacteria bacterium]
MAEREEGVREHLADFLVRLGYAVDVVQDKAGILDRLVAANYHLLLLDERIAGRDLIAMLSESYGNMGVIVMTSTPALESVVAAMRSRASDYVIKPFDLDEITAAVSRVLCRQEKSLEMAAVVETDSLRSTKKRQASNRRQISKAEHGDECCRSANEMKRGPIC